MMFKLPCGCEIRKKPFVAISSWLTHFFFAKMPGLLVQRKGKTEFVNLKTSSGLWDRGRTFLDYVYERSPFFLSSSSSRGNGIANAGAQKMGNFLAILCKYIRDLKQLGRERQRRRLLNF